MDLPPATLSLLLINVLVSAYALTERPSLLERWAFRPVQVLQRGQWYRMITAGFIHTGWWHLAFNAVTLYFFGPILERQLGTGSFVILYLGAEIAAHALTLVLHRSDPGYAAVGASGAVTGVVFGFCLFYPLQRIYLFFVPVGIPAALFAVIFVWGSISAARRENRGGEMFGRIAHEAHVGGAIGGLLLTVLLEPWAVLAFVDQISQLW